MKVSFHIPLQLDKRKPHVWLASWFGCGFINPAPGTWGSLGALPFGVMIHMYGGVYTLAIATVVITVIGFWASTKFDRDMNGHDSKMIVIDEVAGQWLALIPAGLNPLLIALSFLFFRFFDIVKPWPVSHFDRNVKGALGVMGDDILAGIMAMALLYGLKMIG